MLQRCYALLQGRYTLLQRCYALRQRGYALLQRCYALLQRCYANGVTHCNLVLLSLALWHVHQLASVDPRENVALES